MTTSLNLNRGIYIDLDTLFDLRYGTLRQLSKKALIESIKDDSYFYRIYDEFKYVNNIVFKYNYKDRDNTTLKLSPVTKIIEAMASELLLLDSKRFQTGDIWVIEIFINTYGYNITKKDKKRITNILNLLLLNSSINITFIDKKPTDITLTYANDNYSVMFMYDGLAWVDYHTAKKTGQALSTKLFIPSILGKPILLKNKKEIEDNLDKYSELLRLFIDATFLPSDMFSARVQYKDKLLKQLQED